MRVNRFAGCLALCTVLLCAAADAQDEQPATDQIATLAAEPVWQALLHYRRPSLGLRARSAVTTAAFFADAQGATNPLAELQATLQAFADNPASRCRWIARDLWLRRRLGADYPWPEPPDCPDYDRWRQALDVKSVAVVFPAAYLGNPASMFGHTLLRLDGPAGASRLLSHAVTYAAATGEDGGAVYAWKGLTGGYPGRFGTWPYHMKVSSYAHIENRDIWEYPLHLNPLQIDLILAHLWEMREVAFDYYFLRENCAWQILALLDPAMPKAHLIHGFPLWAIPVDTLRRLDQQGLLGEPVYRPAVATRLVRQYRSMSEGQRHIVADLAASTIRHDDARVIALPPAKQARVLEAAHDLAYYQQAEASEAQRAQWLAARSRLPAAERMPKTTPETGPPPQPLASHPSARASVGLLWQQDELGLAMRLRPAYHDLLDLPDGIAPGTGDVSQIEFLDIGLQRDFETGTTQLSDVQLLDIRSLSPRNDWFRPLSWQLSLGLRRRPNLDLTRPGSLGLYAEGGPGLAWRLPATDDRFLYYALALLSLDANRGLHADYSAGPGMEAGILGNLSTLWRTGLKLRAFEYLAGERDHHRSLLLEQHWMLTSELALRLETGWQDRRDGSAPRAQLSLLHYF